MWRVLTIVIALYAAAAGLTREYMANGRKLRAFESAKASLARQVDDLEHANRLAGDERDSLGRDPYYVERTARAVLGWARPIEMSYPEAVRLAAARHAPPAEPSDPQRAASTVVAHNPQQPAALTAQARLARETQAIRLLGYGSVRQFQRATGLKPDGIVGPLTRAKLAQRLRGQESIRVSMASSRSNAG